MVRAAGYLAHLCLGFIILINGSPSFTPESRTVRNIHSPIIALEVARNVDEVDLILGEKPSMDREVMRVKQYWDFGFIAAYSGLYAVMSILAIRKGWRRLGIAALAAGLAAGLLDVIENLGILALCGAPLASTTQAMVDAVRFPSLAKWTLVFAASAMLARFLWSFPGRVPRALALIWFGGSAIGTIGLFENAFLEWAGIPMLAGLAGAAGLFLLRPRTFS